MHANATRIAIIAITITAHGHFERTREIVAASSENQLLIAIAV